MWLVVVALAAMINLRLKVQVKWVPKSTMVIELSNIHLTHAFVIVNSLLLFKLES